MVLLSEANAFFENPFYFNVGLYFLGLLGVFLHWVKKRNEEETWKDLSHYMTTHMKETLILFLSYNLMFLLSWYITSGAKLSPLEVVAYGYSSDSLSSLIKDKKK